MTAFCSPEDVATVACVGAGVIGSGWAAHFLRMGYDVRVWDPAPDAEDRVRTLVDAAWPALENLGLADGASRDRLSVHAILSDALTGVQFVQESAPERIDLKRSLLAEIDAALDDGIVVCSSTSGFPMSEMQVDASGAHRLVVGHPFNPPYLVPLVETVGGDRTADWAVDWAHAFYGIAGKSSIRMDREVPGFIANRLQQAIWHEALYMLQNGEATVEQMDRAITEGPGLRWAFMGPFHTFHLAGGEGGMAHMLRHFEPEACNPWTRLPHPDLDNDLFNRAVDGCDQTLGGTGFTELIRDRDQKLVAILKARKD